MTEYRKVRVPFHIAQELLTEKRREILQALSENDSSSITEIADSLERDLEHVSQDVAELYEQGIIDLETGANSKKPVFEFSEIEIQNLSYGNNLEAQEEGEASGMNNRQKFDLERAAEFYRNQGEKVSLGYVADKFEVPYQDLYKKCNRTFWRRSPFYVVAILGTLTALLATQAVLIAANL